jgi:hypothetical protein
LATPNYGYEKRQRELAKKQKKEEKLRAKNARKLGSDGQAVEDGEALDETAVPDEGASRDSAD